MFKWDSYSDQPSVLKDKKLKKKLKRENIGSYIYTFFISIIMLPISLLLRKRVKQTFPHRVDIFGICVNYDRDSALTIKLLDELKIKKVLIRIFLSDSTDKYLPFLDTLNDYDITFNIIQNRELITDLALLKKRAREVFKVLSTYSNRFVIGNAVNRTKWGFFGMNEYIKFYKTIKDVTDSEFKSLELIGGSVIDYEYYNYAHLLYNFKKISFDAISTQLYVDRRGAPENRQNGLNLQDKINQLYTLVKFSKKCKSNTLSITETNYPISGTAPYAPTSEKECVSVRSYTIYMLRYYLNALATTKVREVYWHQLIAVGYGLVDSRDGTIRESFYALKTMISFLNRLELTKYKQSKDLYEMHFKGQKNSLIVLWSNTKLVKYRLSDDMIAYDMFAKELKTKELEINGEVFYICTKS